MFIPIATYARGATISTNRLHIGLGPTLCSAEGHKGLPHNLSRSLTDNSGRSLHRFDDQGNKNEVLDEEESEWSHPAACWKGIHGYINRFVWLSPRSNKQDGTNLRREDSNIVYFPRSRRGCDLTEYCWTITSHSSWRDMETSRPSWNNRDCNDPPATQNGRLRNMSY